MPTREYHDEDEDDDDWEDDDDEGATDEEDTTEECPYCHEPVYDDAEQCPHCGQYISKEDRPSEPKRWWVVAGVVICLYIIYRWTFG
jgi:hypothetical protein